MSINGKATSYDELSGTVSSYDKMHGALSPKFTIGGSASRLNTIHGKSAYEIAVINGFVGTEEEWLASLKGEPGNDGERGSLVFTPLTSPVSSSGTKNGISYKYIAPNNSVLYYSDVDEVKTGDFVLDSNYLYPVVYVEFPYVYLKDRIYIRGEDGKDVTVEDIENALDAYFAENPIETGATPEQVEQIENNTSAIEAHAEAISETTQAIAEHEEKISNFDSIVQDHEEVVMPTLQDHAEAIAQNQGEINNLVNALTTLEDQTVMHQDDIEQNKTDITGIKQDIAELGEVIPTDEHINDLINTALGVIENGTY